VSAEAWALSWSQPWDVALDRLQEDLDRAESQLSAGYQQSAAAQLSAGSAGGACLPAAPDPAGPLPEHLGDRARELLERTDALAQRVAGELSRTGRELRLLSDRAPEAGAAGRRGHRHPAFLDTRA
jgi:hypothetical protein